MPTWLTDLAQASWVSTWLAPVFLLGFLIFIHELGHFLFARLFDVPVEEFSFGFGPRVTGIRWRGTDYRLNLIPLGGYVKMVGVDPFEPDDVEREDGFLAQPVWKRLIIMAAGPVFNLVIPILLFAGVYMSGAPEPAAWVGDVLPGSPAAEAGIQPGDHITSIDGQEVAFWGETLQALEARAAASAIALGIRRGEADLSVTVAAPPDGAGDVASRLGLDDKAARPVLAVVPGSPADLAGLETDDLVTHLDGEEIQYWFELAAAMGTGEPLSVTIKRRAAEPDGEPVDVTATLTPTTPALAWSGEGEAPQWLSSDGGAFAAPLLSAHPGLPYGVVTRELGLADLSPGHPAERAGMRKDDVVVGMDGRAIGDWAQVTAGVSGAGETGIDFVLLRGAGIVGFHVVPEIDDVVNPDGRLVRTARVGILSAGSFQSELAPMRLGLAPALVKGTRETGELIASTVRGLVRIFVGDLPVSESVSGPIAIVRFAQASASVSIFNFIKLMAFLSISLGMMNLLPIPLLDGGHILFFAVEGIRGQPVSMRFREISHQVGLILLLTLVAFAFINDTRLHILK